MSKGWDDARRAKRAADCRAAKPWQHATGPKTVAGKSQAAQNAHTHGMTTQAMIDLNRAMAQQNRFLKDIMTDDHQ